MAEVGPDDELPDDRVRAGAHLVAEHWERMAVAGCVASCFYRMRGCMKMQMNSTEIVVPLHCRCSSESIELVQCATCTRSFHALCDADVSEELGEKDTEEIDTNFLKENTVSKMPTIPLASEREMNSCEQYICFPCRHLVEVE